LEWEEAMRFPAALIGAVLICGTASAAEEGVCPNPKQMDGFKTCSDVAKAEQEGEVVIYATNPEQAELKVLARFSEMFPKIKPTYLRLQAGALMAKVQSERQAQTYLVDAMQISDMGMILDFQKKNGYSHYVSPEMSEIDKAYKSEPEGYWTWAAIGPAGIAYNPTTVTADEAPKTWEEMLDPKWAGTVTVKVSNSGLQHVSWYELRQLYGADYWKKFAALKPRAFDSYVQQYDRLVNQQDKIIHTAQYSGYLEWKAKGAPVGFNVPPDGMPGTPETWGLVADGPHPNAARLFIDWFLSPVGQKAMEEALYLHSMRPDVPGPPGGLPIKEIRLLLPEDWQAFQKSRPEFQREWDRITGLR
jgi:iron(III) transport system substrate-binding protein